MSSAPVSIQDVIRAAAARSAVLTPETAGYLTLAVLETWELRPGRVAPEVLGLCEDGSVARLGASLDVAMEEAALEVRELLRQLLVVAVGRSKALFAQSRNAEASFERLQGDIEAALIPVNRSAGRRALSRLYREARRAREGGRMSDPPLQGVQEVGAPAPQPERLAVPPVIERPVASPDDDPFADRLRSALADTPSPFMVDEPHCAGTGPSSAFSPVEEVAAEFGRNQGDVTPFLGTVVTDGVPEPPELDERTVPDLPPTAMPSLVPTPLGFVTAPEADAAVDVTQVAQADAVSEAAPFASARDEPEASIHPEFLGLFQPVDKASACVDAPARSIDPATPRIEFAAPPLEHIAPIAERATRRPQPVASEAPVVALSEPGFVASDADVDADEIDAEFIALTDADEIQDEFVALTEAETPRWTDADDSPSPPKAVTRRDDEAALPANETPHSVSAEAEPATVAPNSELATEAPPTYAPRRSDLDKLLAEFEVAESRTDRQLSRDLKRMAGLEPTPPPPSAERAEELSKEPSSPEASRPSLTERAKRFWRNAGAR